MQPKTNSIKYRYLAILPLVLSLSGCETTVDRTLSMAQAETSYSQGDLVRAFKISESLAYQGDPEAQYALGFMYIKGAGVQRDEPLGRLWIEKSAKQGNAKALTAMKMMDEQQSLAPSYPPAKS